MKLLHLLIIILNVQAALVHCQCGYESCPKTKPVTEYINVHLVCHSHDDVGWLKTVDQYYLGTRLDIGPEAVQYILDSVVVELAKNPSRKFIYVESGFFWRWWKSQTQEIKNLVTKFVQNGQLEFISGGWCMNDEGSAHYNAIIDQFSLGLRFLNDTFGQCAIPKAGWQIDSFGHSIEQANIFAKLGFDGLFLGRLDYRDKWNRMDDKEMEMLWATSPNNLGKDASLFTGILYNYYQPPSGFCFDSTCKDDPINDDPDLDDYNVDEAVRLFQRVAKAWESPYNTGHVLMTMGSDFHYMNANMWYKNLDKLIKYVNGYDYSNSPYTMKVNVFYSTPSCYLQEVHRTGKELPIKTTDFFPYSNDYNGFWSGYFSSRPTFKYYIHKANNFLQACKQLAIGGFDGKPNETVIKKVWGLSEPLAILQHHDAITGTAKQHVTDDYSKRLAVGLKSCEEVVDESFRNLLNRSHLTSNQMQEKGHFQFCQLLNISQCIPSEERNEFILSVYNPLARDIHNGYIRIPVSTQFWQVQSLTGLILPQVLPIPSPVFSIPGRTSSAKYELVFKADILPGLGLANYKISTVESASADETELSPIYSYDESLVEPSNEQEENIIITNDKGTTITLDSATGLLKSVSKGSVEMPIKQNFFYYLAMAGNNSQFEWRASGAYIFRPNTSEANGHQPNELVERVQSYNIFKGPHVIEVHQIFNEWVSQVIRLYDTSDLVEFEWLIGPIPIEDGYGKEVITRYSTNLKTKGNFFTDSNGRQLVRRQRGKRDYNFTEFEKVAQNYYPVTSRIIISEDEDLPQDKGPAVIILNDRSQGGTSMNDGEVELLIHRRLLYDDAFGVGEKLDEVQYGKGLTARGKHWLLLAGEGTGVQFSRHREQAQNIFMDKIMGFGDVNLFNHMGMLDQSKIRNAHLFSTSSAVSGLKRALPPNVHLLTLEPISPKQILLRLEHFYEKGEDSAYSEPVKISVAAIKQALPFMKRMRETTLGANQWSENVHRFQWKIKNDTQVNWVDWTNNQGHGQEILLKPMEIKTYLLDLW